MTTTATTKANGKSRHCVAEIDPPAIDFGEAADIVARYAIHGIAQADAIASEPIDWFWTGFIAQQSYVLMGGRPGCGKTSTACLVAVAAAAPPMTPVKLCGKPVKPVAPGKCVFLLLEENSRKSATTQIDRAIEAWGLDRRYVWSRIVLFARAGAKGRLMTEEEIANPPEGDAWAAAVHVAIAKRNVGLLVIDSLARVFGHGRKSNTEEDQAELGDIARPIMDAGAVVVVIVHVRKDGGAITEEDIAGSTQRSALGDNIIAIEPVKKKRLTAASKVTLIKQREIVDDDDKPNPVTVTLASKDGRWTITEAGAPEDDDSKLPHERVLAYVIENGEQPKQVIRDALGMSGASLEAAITKLFTAKAITKSPKKIDGRNCEVISVRTRKKSRVRFRSAQRRGGSGLEGVGGADDV